MSRKTNESLKSRMKIKLSLPFPVDDDIDGVPLRAELATTGGFIPSKWETVDPDQIEAQAITTSKWDTLDPVAPEPPMLQPMNSDDSFDSFDNDGRDADEEKRVRLREVELKSIQYQDELESGQRSLKSGWTVQQQTEHYRRKLMKRTYREAQDSPSSGRDSRSQTSSKHSPSPVDGSRRAKKLKRSPSPTSSRTSRRKSRDSESPSRSSRSTRRERNRSRSYSRSRSRSVSLSPRRHR